MYFTSAVKITFFKRLYHKEKAWEPIHTFTCVQTVSLFLIKKILAAFIPWQVEFENNNQILPAEMKENMFA